jgi:hypothetical protein
MNSRELIKPQYWLAQNGQVYPGFHIQLIDPLSKIVQGETGWVDATVPGGPRTARLELVSNPKHEIFVDYKLRNTTYKLGTDLLRLLIKNLAINSYETFVIHGITIELMHFYLRALSKFHKEGPVADQSITANLIEPISSDMTISTVISPFTLYHQAKNP